MGELHDVLRRDSGDPPLNDHELSYLELTSGAGDGVEYPDGTVARIFKTPLSVVLLIRDSAREKIARKRRNLS